MRFCDASYPGHCFGTVDKRNMQRSSKEYFVRLDRRLAQTAERANHWNLTGVPTVICSGLLGRRRGTAGLSRPLRLGGMGVGGLLVERGGMFSRAWYYGDMLPLL